MKNQNIVCFGPTNSGKSTLAGYLYSHKLTNTEYERKVQQFRAEYGNEFRERRILSYFVDTGKDEYQDQKGTPGTSKRKHISLARLEEDLACTVIDTPGTDKRWRNGFQGIYMGDIGIFVIEINKLESLYKNHIEGSYEYERALDQLLVPVSLWEKYGRIERLIIAISKMDLCDYSRYIFARAEKLLKERSILKNVPIVPMAISVKGRSDVNVFSESERFPNHKSLLSEIKEILVKTDSADVMPSNGRMFAAIDKRFDKTEQTGEPALRIKMIDGDIKIGSPVMVGPVKYGDGIIDLKGYVKSLMYEADQRSVDMLSKNHIGGVVFSKLQNGRDLLGLKDVELINTSVIMDPGSAYICGNFLVFSVKYDTVSRALFKESAVDKDIKLVWFGKISVLRIIAVTKKMDHYQICVMNTKIDNYPFYFPKDPEGSIIYKDYVLQYNDEFMRASIKKVITISKDNRKDVTLCLKGDYRERLSQKGYGDMFYIENNDMTVLDINRISGLNLTGILFDGDIDKTDILEVAIK